MTKFLSILLSIINFTLPLPAFEIPEPTPELVEAVEVTPTPEPVYIRHDNGSYTVVTEGQDGTDVSLEDLR